MYLKKSVDRRTILGYFFWLVCSVRDFFDDYPPSNGNDFLKTIYEEVDEEYEPKDDLVLAYCNYHFSRENGNIQLLLRYLENASLSNPIFIRDINQYAKPFSSSYNYLNDLKRLISLMKSNHCEASLKQYFKEPLKLEEVRRDERRVHDLIQLYYNITGENPSFSREFLKAIKLLKEKNYNEIKDRERLIRTITEFLSKGGIIDECNPKNHATIIDELIKRNILTEDDKSNALKHLLGERKYTEILVLYNIANIDELARKGILSKEEDKFSRADLLIDLLKHEKYADALILYDVANEDLEPMLVYEAINCLWGGLVIPWNNDEFSSLFQKYNYDVKEADPSWNVCELYDEVCRTKLDENQQKGLRDEIKTRFMQRIYEDNKISNECYCYFNELIKLVEFMQ